MQTTPITVTAERTDCRTQQKSTVNVTFAVKHYAHGDALNMEGGPTGYEGFMLNVPPLHLQETGWWACAGTEGRWDGLFVPGAEIQKVFAHLVEEGVITAQ